MLHAHVLAAGPVLVHVEFKPHAPLLVTQLLTTVQFLPLAELYPELQTHVLVNDT